MTQSSNSSITFSEQNQSQLQESNISTPPLYHSKFPYLQIPNQVCLTKGELIITRESRLQESLSLKGEILQTITQSPIPIVVAENTNSIEQDPSYGKQFNQVTQNLATTISPDGLNQKVKILTELIQRLYSANPPLLLITFHRGWFGFEIEDFVINDREFILVISLPIFILNSSIVTWNYIENELIRIISKLTIISSLPQELGQKYHNYLALDFESEQINQVLIQNSDLVECLSLIELVDNAYSLIHFTQSSIINGSFFVTLESMKESRIPEVKEKPKSFLEGIIESIFGQKKATPRPKPPIEDIFHFIQFSRTKEVEDFIKLFNKPVPDSNLHPINEAFLINIWNSEAYMKIMTTIVSYHFSSFTQTQILEFMSLALEDIISLRRNFSLNNTPAEIGQPNIVQYSANIQSIIPEINLYFAQNFADFPINIRLENSNQLSLVGSINQNYNHNN